jgi:hypothetical protein
VDRGVVVVVVVVDSSLPLKSEANPLKNPFFLVVDSGASVVAGLTYSPSE